LLEKDSVQVVRVVLSRVEDEEVLTQPSALADYWGEFDDLRSCSKNDCNLQIHTFPESFRWQSELEASLRLKGNQKDMVRAHMCRVSCLTTGDGLLDLGIGVTLANTVLT